MYMDTGAKVLASTQTIVSLNPLEIAVLIEDALFTDSLLILTIQHASESHHLLHYTPAKNLADLFSKANEIACMYDSLFRIKLERTGM